MTPFQRDRLDNIDVLLARILAARYQQQAPPSRRNDYESIGGAVRIIVGLVLIALCIVGLVEMCRRGQDRPPEVTLGVRADSDYMGNLRWQARQIERGL